MPIYEYQCATCENRFEELAKFGDPPPPCPQCQGTSERVMSDIGGTTMRSAPKEKAQLNETKRINAKRAAEQRAREGK